MIGSFASIVLYWVYMNRSRCHEDTWTVGLRHLTRHQASTHSEDIWPTNGIGVKRCQRGCPVLRRGGVSWTDVVGVKGWCQGGARCEEVSCEVSVCEQRASCRLVVVPAGCSLNGVVPTRHVDRNKAMISSSGRVFLWYRLWLMMVPVD